MKFKCVKHNNKPSSFTFIVGQIYDFEFKNDKLNGPDINGKNLLHYNITGNVWEFELVESSNQINELPEKWYLENLNREELKIVGTFYKQFINSDCYINYHDVSSHNLVGVFIKDSDKSTSRSFSGKRGTKITFEQFKQLILNKNEQQNNKTNEVQRIINSDRETIRNSGIRCNSRNCKITIGTRLSLNQISSKPSRNKVKESRTTGSIFKSVYS